MKFVIYFNLFQVAAYARCYLCRVGMTVTNNRDFITENLNDFLFVYHTVQNKNNN